MDSRRREEDVTELLRSTYQAFSDVLDKMQDKIEFGLKVLWDRERVVANLVQNARVPSRFALGALFVLVAAIPVARRLGMAYAVFILINILPPLSARDWMPSSPTRSSQKSIQSARSIAPSGRS